MIKRQTKLSFSDVSCPYCESENVFEYRIEAHGKVYDLVRCGTCGNEQTFKITPVSEPKKILINVEDLD